MIWPENLDTFNLMILILNAYFLQRNKHLVLVYFEPCKFLLAGNNLFTNRNGYHTGSQSVLIWASQPSRNLLTSSRSICTRYSNPAGQSGPVAWGAGIQLKLLPAVESEPTVPWRPNAWNTTVNIVTYIKFWYHVANVRNGEFSFGAAMI